MRSACPRVVAMQNTDFWDIALDSCSGNFPVYGAQANRAASRFAIG
jgi:hypothetical protein